MSCTEEIRGVFEEQRFFDDVGQEMDFINSLDDYSLEHIFMLLPICDRMNIQRVCTRWKVICKQAWYDIKEYKCSYSIGGAYYNQLLTQSYVERLMFNCGTYLQDLSLSKVCDSSIMPIIGKRCYNLTSLEFVFDEKDDRTFRYIQAFKELDKIKIIKIHVINLQFGYEMSLTGLIVPKIVSSLSKKINEIHIMFKEAFDEPWFIELRRFKNLQSLTLSGCNLDKIIHHISEKETLVYLNLEHSDLSDRASNIDAGIFKKLVNLEYIHLFVYDDNITPYFIKTILDTCKNMRYFKMTPIDFEDPDSVAPIENWKNHNKLEHFAITWVLSYETACKMVKYCDNLKHLTFYHGTTNAAMQKLTEIKNLESLENHFSHNLSDESIFAISNNCKKLKHLAIPDEYQLYNSDIEDRFSASDNSNDEPVLLVTVFDELSKLEFLESLNVSGLHKFTDSSIIAVANQCKRIKCLNVSYCKNITGVGLDAITRIESLQTLNVASIQSVSNSFINKLKNLKLLKVNNCKEVTDSSIILFIKNCPDLEHLYLFRTKITIDTVDFADRETKYRKNNIILHLHSSISVPPKYCEPKMKSKWLDLCYLD